MAQAWTEEKLLKVDPLQGVKEEVQHGSPHLKHVVLHEKTSEDVQMEDVVKSEVTEPFVVELKDDHYMAAAAHDLGGSQSRFMEADPLHNVKQEIECSSPYLKHVETPDSPMAAPQDGDVVKSDVPEAFEEELKNDHGIVDGQYYSVWGKEEDVAAPGGAADEACVGETKDFNVVPTVGSNPRSVSGRTSPLRISGHHGMRPGGPLSRDVKSEATNLKEGAPNEGKASDDGKSEDSSTVTNEESSPFKLFSSRGIPGRETPSYRVSAQHGMRPGGVLSRDLKFEGTESMVSGELTGADLSRETKPRGPGVHRGPGRGSFSSSGSRRGGLARTGSGLPSEQKGGSSLARTGSGVAGNSLARTGSAIPSSEGCSDMKKFSSFLDSSDCKEEKDGPAEQKASRVVCKIGDKWNQPNSYDTAHVTKNSAIQETEGSKDTVVEKALAPEDSSGEKTLSFKHDSEDFFHKIKEGVKDQLVPTKE